MNSEVQSILTSGVTLTDAALERLLPAATTEPHSIHRAMRHSVFAGGKRLRPILCMEAARMVAAGTGHVPAGAAGLPPGAAGLGAAIEMAHTYSLIHDDLPALDNDDLRRGKPTCHVVYGEAIAILAGDALQNLAFQVIAGLSAPPATIVAILRDFALSIGSGVGAPTGIAPGMIGGQVMDIEASGAPNVRSLHAGVQGEGHTPTAELVERIHRAKTGALITTSIVCGGLLGLAHATTESGVPGPASGTQVSTNLGHTDILIRRLRTFGEKAGLAFQIVDDILDMTQTSAELGKTAGKDTAAIKATWPAVYGLERSKQDAASLIADAFAALTPFGPAATPLKSLAQYLVDRTH
jgi:geranylgeranyl diphosphate synthase type II